MMIQRNRFQNHNCIDDDVGRGVFELYVFMVKFIIDIYPFKWNYLNHVYQITIR
jgi:hypothetical protein